MNILFTCGGTAGHVNPAVALARIFQDKHPGCRVLFVGADGGMETRLVPKEGYPIRTVTITNFHRSLAPADIVPETEGKEAAMRFQLLTNQEGQPFFPAFTGWEELRKLCGPKNQQTVALTFDHYAGMVLRDNRAAGFVIDPMGACLTFDRNMMEHLVQRKQEMGK